MAKFRKAILAAAVAAAGAFSAGIADGQVNTSDVVTVLVAAVVAGVGVYNIRNTIVKGGNGEVA